MMSMRDKNWESQIFEEQLFQAKQALFRARSVREIKFLQSKINYLMEKLKESKKARTRR